MNIFCKFDFVLGTYKIGRYFGKCLSSHCSTLFDHHDKAYLCKFIRVNLIVTQFDEKFHTLLPIHFRD